MKRRNFIKTTFATGLGVIMGRYYSWGASKEYSSLLIESSKFQDKGGWVIDQQFMDQMGSPFLLAHGLGKSVDDAVAKVKFLEPGKYRLWVRTRDWVAPWKSSKTKETIRAHGTPGIFEVLINGQPAEITFGDRNDKWHWQDGGVVSIGRKECEISLHDLTGFEGRCAAIFFTKDLAMVPPDGGEALQRFRRKWHGYSEQPTDAGTFDLVVVGGGLSGLGAAISAAREGLIVALIHDRPVLGGNNSSEVRVSAGGWPGTDLSMVLGSVMKDLEHTKKCMRKHSGNTADQYQDEKKLEAVTREKTLSFFPFHRMNQVAMQGNKIEKVITEDIETGERLSFRGKVFADCTGDGAVGVLAGADFEMTVDDKNGHMGRCNQWYTYKYETKKAFPKCPWALDLSEKPFPGREGYPGGTNLQHPGLMALGTNYWESGYNHDPIVKSEYIRDYNFRAIYGAWDALKNVDKAYPNRNLDWIAYISGKRESRRLLGDVILTKEDIKTSRFYEDALVPASWSIDVHVPNERFLNGFEGDPFISLAIMEHYLVPYFIPYRCLYSRNIENLFMAGRDVSVTHEALGAVRVMRTCCLMGEVVGRAAALCLWEDTNPRGVYEDHLDELITLNGYEKKVSLLIKEGRKPKVYPKYTNPCANEPEEKLRLYKEGKLFY